MKPYENWFLHILWNLTISGVFFAMLAASFNNPESVHYSYAIAVLLLYEIVEIIK
jgi:hypothetical protein